MTNDFSYLTDAELDTVMDALHIVQTTLRTAIDRNGLDWMRDENYCFAMAHHVEMFKEAQRRAQAKASKAMKH